LISNQVARAWDHVDLRPIKPITTRINLFRATCPCCKARVTAQPPADLPEGSPFGPGLKAAVAYLHGCQMVGFKVRRPVRPDNLPGRDLQHAGTYGQAVRRGSAESRHRRQLASTGEAASAPYWRR
jgi:hypothetical protein